MSDYFQWIEREGDTERRNERLGFGIFGKAVDGVYDRNGEVIGSRVEQLVARQSHDLKVAGSSPASTTGS